MGTTAASGKRVATTTVRWCRCLTSDLKRSLVRHLEAMVLQLHEYLMRCLSDIHTSPHQRKHPRIMVQVQLASHYDYAHCEGEQKQTCINSFTSKSGKKSCRSSLLTCSRQEVRVNWSGFSRRDPSQAFHMPATLHAGTTY